MFRFRVIFYYKIPMRTVNDRAEYRANYNLMKQLDNVDSITIYKLLIVRLTAHVLESSILTFGHSLFSLLLPRCHAFIHISSPSVSFRHYFFSRHASKLPVLSHFIPVTSMLLPNFLFYSS